MATISAQQTSRGSSSKESYTNPCAVTDEPYSKRLRVAAREDVVIIDGASSVIEDASERSPARKASKSPSTLSAGMRVRLHGFDARPHLNGLAGRLRGFHAAHARWLVSMDDASEKLILNANLEPDTSVPTSTAIGEGKSQVVSDAGAESTEMVLSTHFSTTDTLPIHDCVSAHFQFSRREGLRRVEEITAKTCAEVSQLRCDVNQRCSQYRQHFQQYCQMSKPTKLDQQLARNSVREQLQRQGNSVMTAMQRLLDAAQEPTMLLHAIEKDLLEQIDLTMDMLAKLRADTVTSFIQYEDKLEVDCLANQAALQSLAPGLQHVDNFMQRFYAEVECEKAHADSIYKEMLVKLQNQERDFVEANESPSNPLYAKVKDDLAALNQRLEEQATTDALHVSLMQSWHSMLKSLPSKIEEVKAKPAKRTFWRHLKCSNRAASTST